MPGKAICQVPPVQLTAGSRAISYTVLPCARLCSVNRHKVTCVALEALMAIFTASCGARAGHKICTSLLLASGKLCNHGYLRGQVGCSKGYGGTSQRFLMSSTG